MKQELKLERNMFATIDKRSKDEVMHQVFVNLRNKEMSRYNIMRKVNLNIDRVKGIITTLYDKGFVYYREEVITKHKTMILFGLTDRGMLFLQKKEELQWLIYVICCGSTHHSGLIQSVLTATAYY